MEGTSLLIAKIVFLMMLAGASYAITRIVFEISKPEQSEKVEKPKKQPDYNRLHIYPIIELNKTDEPDPYSPNSDLALCGVKLSHITNQGLADIGRASEYGSIASHWVTQELIARNRKLRAIRDERIAELKDKNSQK